MPALLGACGNEPADVAEPHSYIRGFTINPTDPVSCLEQVLDLVGEDAAGIAASKGSYHWDKRHRKYVQLQPGEAVRAGKRVKAGTGTPVSPRHHKIVSCTAAGHRRPGSM